MTRGLLILVSLLAAPVVSSSPVALVAGAFGVLTAVLLTLTAVSDAVEGRRP